MKFKFLCKIFGHKFNTQVWGIDKTDEPYLIRVQCSRCSKKDIHADLTMKVYGQMTQKD